MERGRVGAAEEEEHRRGYCGEERKKKENERETCLEAVLLGEDLSLPCF